ncbi:MAG: hypothetical protein ACYSUI_11475 [Planctomycetota bacterium]
MLAIGREEFPGSVQKGPALLRVLSARTEFDQERWLGRVEQADEELRGTVEPGENLLAELEEPGGRAIVSGELLIPGSPALQERYIFGGKPAILADAGGGATQLDAVVGDCHSGVGLHRIWFLKGSNRRSNKTCTPALPPDR